MMPGTNHGQTLNDRINAARYALAGQGLARVVCKATTEEMIAPKKKHIDYLLQCTDEPNVSIPQLANLLIERTQHSSWIVVFKALVTVHHLMCYGNERFTQYLASSNCNFQLNNYLDKSLPKGYDMSIFIRRYARYISNKALSYRTVAFDFTKVKRGDESQLRQMGVEKLIKTVPVLQGQIDSLLEFDCNANDLTNGVIKAAFFLLFKDLIRLFACYNDGIITCLEKYFELTNKKLARETLDIYKKFLIRMNKIAEFLKVAENVGIDRGEIPDLTKAPSSLLDAMEQHLAAMEGRKPGTTSNGDKISDENTVKKAIEEEEQFLNKLKEKHLQEKKVNNPFLALSSSPNKTSSEENSKNKEQDKKNNDNQNDMIDLLMDSNCKTSNNNQDDLFSLNATKSSSSSTAMQANNPFADILSSLNIPTAGGSQTASSGGAGEFATSDGFAAAFGSSSNSNIVLLNPQAIKPADSNKKSIIDGFDAFGDVLQPQNVQHGTTKQSPNDLKSTNIQMNNVNNNHIVPICSSSSSTTTTLTTLSNNVPRTTTPSSSTSTTGIVKGDLDATLASLAQNLEINGLKGNYKRGQQFNPCPRSTMKTGGGTITTTSSTTTTNTNGSVSPSSMMMIRTTPIGAGPVGWNNNNINNNNIPILGVTGLGGAVNWTAATSMAQQPTTAANIMKPTILQPAIMTSILGQPSTQPPLVMSNTFQIRQASMIPGSVQVLPTANTGQVNASTLSSILAAAANQNKINNNQFAPFGSSSNNNNNNNNNQSTNNSQSIDPFGAL